MLGHVCRTEDERPLKIVMLGMVEGDAPRGRPVRKWSDDIADWCGCKLALYKMNGRKTTGVSGPHGP